MWDGSTGDEFALNEHRGMDEFKFSLGDVVLAEWEDKLFYAKIQKIDRVCGKCTLIFDDDSVEECPFSKIHSVTETTAEIVCIICKDGTSLRPNEIVLCDKCGIGYHQHCHDPAIPPTALEFDAPWMCVYCSIGAFCPYLENPFESKPTRKGVRKTKIHTLKSGEPCVTSGNSTEDEKDLPRDGIKASEISSPEMSSYYFSSHIHQSDGSKPRGRTAFGHKSKTTGDKRGRGTGRPSGRPGVRDRDHYTEIDVNQQRKSSHHYHRHGSEISRHSGRYESPVRRNGEDSGDRKLSPTRESRKYQHTEENKAAKVISHRRDAPREKQRLTQDLARQKRLLSEDIARAELLQREQLTKKFTDMFELRKDGLGADRGTVEGGDESMAKDNFHAEMCRELEKESSPSMYERCYGEYSPDSNGEDNKRGLTQGENSDMDCKMPAERESLFDRFLRKESAQEIKNIEFVNESKVEVRGLRYKNSSLVNNCPDGLPCEADSVSDARSELEPLKFENVTDDELAFSDGDRNTSVLENSKICAEKFKANGESPTFPKEFVPAENGLDTMSEAKCNGLEETCDYIDSSTQNHLYSEENMSTNHECESCECPSEEGDPKCDDKSTESTERCDDRGLDPDHSTIKSSKIARLMEEPDMQCEHSSKHSDDCESQENQVFLEINGESNNVEEVNSVHSTDLSEKQCLQVENKSKQVSNVGGGFESKGVGERADAKENQTFDLHEKESSQSNSYSVEQNSENVANESELSNIEGMSDAGELSEPEAGAFVNRGKVKKKKRRKPKINKGVHLSGSTTVRRKTKANKNRSPVKDAKATKRIKQLDSESDDDILRNKSQEWTDPSDLTPARVVEANGYAGRNGEKRPLSPNDEHFLGDSVEEVVARGIVGSDNCDSSQEANVFSDTQRNTVEEDEKREQVKIEKKIGKTKRKSEEKEKERERSTPPHLISQNRYARDLPRHNWLVERLLQQNKLCAEDTLQHARDSKDEQGKEDNPAGDEHEANHSIDKENPLETSTNSPLGLNAEMSVVNDSASPKNCTDHEDPESPTNDGFQNELHRSFLRRSFPPNVPRALPRLKPSTTDSSSGNENKPPPPTLKHALSSKEPCGLEPVPKLRKIFDEKEAQNEPQLNGELNSESLESQGPDSSEVEQPRKVISPIEILDDEDEKKKRGRDETKTNDEKSQATDQHSGSKLNETGPKDGKKSPVKSLRASPTDKQMPFSSPKKPFSTVNPTIPGSVKDKFGRPMDMPPHRAAILIPVVPMHDGSGIPISPGLNSASPHMKGYSPRTFTPHLLTHSAGPVPGSGMFGNPLSQGGRYSAGNCGHHMHGNIKSGIPCKRDVNCPFHGNNPRGIPTGILDIPGHHGPMHPFGAHSHDHMSAVMSRERRERDKGSSRSPPGREVLGDKQLLQTPKVVKPIAHVPGKRPPLMLSHLQQIAKQPASLRELEALHDDKAQRFGADLLLSPHQLQTSPDRSPREQVVPNVSPLHECRPVHQQLTLSDLNRRREEEMMKIKVDEGVKSKPLPGEFLSSGLPSPSRGPAKLTSPPHSKESNLLSPGRGHRSASMSPVDKREHVLSLRRMGEDREPVAIMGEFLKPGPPRLRPLDEADLKLPAERQRREELLLTRRHNSPFLRVSSTKDPVMHPLKVSEGVEIVGPRGIELLEQAGRVEREKEREIDEKVGPKSAHGNSSIISPGVRLLEDKRKSVEDVRQSSSRDEQRGREHASPEMEHRLRLEQTAEPKSRSRSLELVQLKEKEPRKEMRDSDSIRIPVSERERPDDLVLLRAGEGSSRPRLPLEPSPPLRHKLYPERAFLPAGLSSRIDPRVDSRMVALHELEMHRRGEALRASEPSHRELLSRMASSLPINKGSSPIGKALFVRPDGSLERRAPDSGRLSSDVHVYSPPTSLSSREYGLMMNSRQAMERLAAAAGKPGSLLADVGKDMPPHIKQDIARERERERQRLSLEQIEANRRLLHAELKDKVNPLVFSKEHQIRIDQRREHMDALRARDKRMSDRERLLFMERIAEEKKRRFSEIDPHGGILMRHSSFPQFGHLTDREEYERVKRLKVSEPSVSAPGSIQHSKHLSSSSLHSERKDPQLSSPKNNVLNSSQVRQKTSEVSDGRVGHPRENELVRKTSNGAMFERDSIWQRNRELVALAQGGMGGMELKRPNLPSGAALHGFMPPKVGPRLSQREESKGSGGKPDDDGVNRCSVCKRDASFLCSGCQAAWYCSSECQLSAWGTHNRECSQNKRQ